MGEVDKLLQQLEYPQPPVQQLVEAVSAEYGRKDVRRLRKASGALLELDELMTKEREVIGLANHVWARAGGISRTEYQESKSQGLLENALGQTAPHPPMIGVRLTDSFNHRGRHEGVLLIADPNHYVYSGNLGLYESMEYIRFEEMSAEEADKIRKHDPNNRNVLQVPYAGKHGEYALGSHRSFLFRALGRTIARDEILLGRRDVHDVQLLNGVYARSVARDAVSLLTELDSALSQQLRAGS